MHTCRSWALLVAIALAVPVVPTVARAEPTAADLASARDLMKEGRALRDQGIGKLVEARETLGEIANMATDPKESESSHVERSGARAR